MKNYKSLGLLSLLLCFSQIKPSLLEVEPDSWGIERYPRGIAIYKQNERFTEQEKQALTERYERMFEAMLAAGGNSQLVKKEALNILDINSNNPSWPEIQFAYHNLMLMYHPDKGGITLVAAVINAAMDELRDIYGRR